MNQDSRPEPATGKPRSGGVARRAFTSLRGLAAGWRRERAVRELWIGLSGGWLFLAIAGIGWHWWAIVVAISAASLAGEYFNSAIEASLDRLHPERHPAIGEAKDIASAAAFLLNCAAFAAITLALLIG